MQIGDYIKFYNDDIIIFLWDENEEEWIEESLHESDISINRLLRNIIVFDKELTVKGFLRQLYPYINDIEHIFESSLYGMKLKPFYDIIDFENDQNDDDEIDYIEVYWRAEIWDDELVEYISYHGIPNENSEESIPISLMLTKLSEYQNCKIKIDNSYDIIYMNNEKGINCILSTTKEMTLFQLLDGFLFELTYTGYPEEQERKSKEILKEVEKIEENDIGEYGIDDLQLEIKQEQLNEAIKNEQYEKAQKIKKEIDKLKNKKE